MNKVEYAQFNETTRTILGNFSKDYSGGSTCIERKKDKVSFYNLLPKNKWVLVKVNR